MSDAVPEWDDQPVGPVSFQKDPVRTRRRQRTALSVFSVIAAAWWALVAISPDFRPAGIVMGILPTLVLLILIKFLWNLPPPVLAFDERGVARRSTRVPWDMVSSIKLEWHRGSENYLPQFRVLYSSQGENQILLVSPFDFGVDVPAVADAFEHFAPAHVLDSSVRELREGPFRLPPAK